jgi:hypothetical protein
MNTFWHFLISNLRYNKIELGISYFISFSVIVLFNYFKADKNPDGDILFSVAFYAMLYAFYSNKRKINLKYLLSLPLSKSQLILTKVTSDFVYFIPSMGLAFWGIMHTKLEFSAIPLIIILFQAVTFVAFVIFDGDVEQPRLENAKSSFINRLIYARKAIDFMFLSVFVVYVAMAVNMSPMSMAIKQYFIIIILSLVLGFKFHRTLKLMKVESLSYFIPKRDLFKIGWKLAAFAVPAIAFHLSGYQMPSKFGNEPLYSKIQYGKTKGIKEEILKISKLIKSKKGYTPLTAAIFAGRVDVLELLNNKGFNISWNEQVNTEEVQGLYPIHLAAMSGKGAMVGKLLKENPSVLNQISADLKTTPIGLAAKKCLPEVVDTFIKNGADINLQDKSGDTPLILASKNNCFATVSILIEAGAQTDTQNNKKKIALEYIRESRYKYLFTRHSTSKTRGLAGSNDVSSEPIKFQELLPPKLLRQEK